MTKPLAASSMGIPGVRIQRTGNSRARIGTSCSDLPVNMTVPLAGAPRHGSREPCAETGGACTFSPQTEISPIQSP